MEYALLVLLALTLGAGVAGGLLSAWSCHRRILALEQNSQLLFTSLEDRIQQLTKIATRQDKVAAATARWTKKDAEVEAIAQLAKNAAPANMHPWDPRTWGNGNG